MGHVEGEGVKIATMIGADGRSIVGWVYRWNEDALAIRWTEEGPQRVRRCKPELSYAQLRDIDFDRWTKF